MELLIVGLDGLSYNMLDRFDIELEFLERVRSEGVSGHLMSVDTPTTVPAWTSFATGKDPGSHGIPNMVRQDSNYEIGPARTNTTDAAGYDLLDDSMFINLPASIGRIPAGKNSHLVSAMLARDKFDAVPEHLQSFDTFEEYILDHDGSLKMRPNRYLDHVCEITVRRHAFAREAFEKYDPRMGFLLFSTPDWAGHILSNLSSDEKRRQFYSQLVTLVDDLTADLAEQADNVVLMSDHGFEYKHTNIHLAEWLNERNYFVERESGTSVAGIAVDVAKTLASHSDRLYSLMRRVHNHIMGTELGSALESQAGPDVNYARSTAWQLRYGCIYINDDRFDDPSVDDEAVEQLRTEIRDGLLELTDDDGNPIFRDVLFPEEAYTDPDPDSHLPNVIARPAPGYFPTTLWSPTGGYTSPTENYEHRYNGLFAASGPLFGSGEIERMSIIDVLPTVMAALGEPLSPEFDGVARTDALADDVTITELSLAEIPEPRLRETEDDQSGRDQVVEDRLADLGYIE